MRVNRFVKIILRRKCNPWSLFAVSGVVILLVALYVWFPNRRIHLVVPFQQCRVAEKTQTNIDLDLLMTILADPNERQAHAWIRLRIQKLWKGWVKAINSKIIQDTFVKKPRRRKKILMHLGFLSADAGLQFAERQFKGGYLGELVQWSDLIASLYVLGHDLTVISEVEQLKQHHSFFEPAENKCDDLHDNPSLIYTDIIGNGQIRRHVIQPEYHYKCRIRIMDCFGTEPAYNNREYMSTHNASSRWGGLDFNTQQFLTMFPHTPDNSFVGFVVPTEYTNGQDMRQYKEDIGLVYGKTPNLWQDKAEYLKVFIQNGFTLHATLRKNDETHKDPDVLPEFVINHGYMNGSDLRDLMKRAKLYIGLGEPLEGPAPLEAIASGAVFINPKFDPPLKYRNRNKPTERELTSQNPYVDSYTGAPYVYTVKINNLMDVDAVLKKILKTDYFKAYLPFEFTFEGHLQRMSSYIEYQDFCHTKLPKWPPIATVQTVFGTLGQSCKDACAEKGLVCEPNHFETINTIPNIKYKRANCTKFKTQSDLYYPAIDTDSNTCVIQNNRKWFSCVGGDRKLVRACPCRNYIPQQTALCKGCE